MLSIATGKHKADTVWPTRAISWDEFVTWLDLDHPANRKDCGAFVGGRLTGNKRSKATVEYRSIIALDADKASQSFFVDWAVSIGAEAAMYTTWSHKPESPRWRLCAPLSRDVTTDEHRLIVRALMIELGYQQFDKGSEEPERLMHRPSTQVGYAYHRVSGDWLDVDEWLAKAKELGLEVAPEREPYFDDSPMRDPSLGVHPYAARGIANELARLDALKLPWAEGDGWRTTIFKVACNLIEFANSNWSGYSLDDAERDIHLHAPTDEGWMSKNNDIEFDGAYITVAGKGRANPDETPADVFDVVEVESSSEPSNVLKQFPRLDLEAVLDPDRPPRQWLWEEVIPVGDQASIVAPGGTGKSLLTLALCMAAVSGQVDFIGRSLDFAGRVLYVDMENSEDDWAERLGSLGWTQESIRKVADRFIPLSLPPLRGLDTAKGAEQLKSIVSAYNICKGDLLVLDSTQRVTEGEENSNDTLRALYNLTSAWLKSAGITVIRTDNTGWDNSRERGASAKRDDVGYALLLEPVGAKKDGAFRLKNTKHRAKGSADALKFIRGTDGNGRLVFTADVHEFAQSDFELPVHQGDTLLRVWMLTNPDDARFEAEIVSHGRALSGVTAKSDLKRNGLEQLVKDGYLVKVPRFNANGMPSKAAPGIAVATTGQEWIEYQGDRVNDRLDEIARKAQT